jgi:folate-dependent tRNA-U54 methylase TrmFO/GidA
MYGAFRDRQSIFYYDDALPLIPNSIDVKNRYQRFKEDYVSGRITGQKYRSLGRKIQKTEKDIHRKIEDEKPKKPLGRK